MKEVDDLVKPMLGGLRITMKDFPRVCLVSCPKAGFQALNAGTNCVKCQYFGGLLQTKEEGQKDMKTGLPVRFDQCYRVICSAPISRTLQEVMY